MVLETGLHLLDPPLLLKPLERRQCDEGLRRLFTLHAFEIRWTKPKVDLIAGLRILLRLENVRHALKLFLAHDLCLEDQLVAVEFVLLLELIVPAVLDAR